MVKFIAQLSVSPSGVTVFILYYPLRQHFPNCGLSHKSGSRSSVKWVAQSFSKYLFFRNLFINSKNACYVDLPILNGVHKSVYFCANFHRKI